MERMQVAVGFLLSISVIIALSLVTVGGMTYLFHHGHDVIHYSKFLGEPAQDTSLGGILSAFRTSIHAHKLSLLSKALIQLGVWILIVSQILRIALVAWYFAKLQDYKFTGISVFVLFSVLAVSFGAKFI